MKPVGNDTVLKQLQWRYATKKFDSTRKISAEDWKTLEQALVLAPSSCGLQPWKFIVVTDPEVRQKLLPASWGQRQVVDASHLVVFLGKNLVDGPDIDALMKRTAQVRGVPAESLEPFRQMVIGTVKALTPEENERWNARQVYIALGQFMAAAAMLGIDTCPMEGFEHPKYDEILGLKHTGYHSLVLCPAGYRSAEDKYAGLAKVRFEAKDVIQHIA
jgi:nitroreductase